MAERRPPRRLFKVERPLLVSLVFLAVLAYTRFVWPRAGTGWGGTMTEWMPVSRIDQVWVSRRVLPVAASVVPGSPSDHRLLVADLILQ